MSQLDRVAERHRLADGVRVLGLVLAALRLVHVLEMAYVLELARRQLLLVLLGLLLDLAFQVAAFGRQGIA